LSLRTGAEELHNCYLKERTARDIDERITKILKDLGDPEPPLRLEIVREQLKLDLAFYSTSDTGVLAETIHRLRVAGKQVLQRPSLLIDAVKRWDLKALWVPDRKRILIDSELPSAKQRWGEAHEIGHSILPWHDTVMHGDRKQTMSLACELQVESEANFAAGRLLFLQDVFVDHLRASSLTFASIKSLSKVFGNTMTSTLWRAVEASEQPVFGLVSQHPRHTLGEEPLRYFVRSRRFEQQFGEIAAMQIFAALKAFCRGNRGPIGSGEILLTDANGEQYIFFVEVFFNTHDALTLGVHQAARVPITAV
jgi:hypothetical protein